MHVLRYGAESRLNVLGYAMHVLSLGADSRTPSQCIRIGNACIKIGDACFKIGNSIRQRISIVESSYQCIKIWNGSFSALCDNFRHAETFSKKVFFCCTPAQADKYYACL